MVKTVKRLSLWIFFGLLAYMPLHIFLSTWIGTSFGVLEAAKIAKDVVLIAGLLLALAASVREPWFRKLLHDKLIWLILAYGLFTALMALVKPTDTDAELLGVVYNTRFLLFFLYAALLCRLFAARHVTRRALQIVFGVGMAVLFFGIIQRTVLPDDALTHFGYQRSNGVLPAFFIDDKPDLERVMSTLRDPNSLGSYAIIIGVAALAFRLRSKNRDLKAVADGLMALSVLCLWFTFGRGAWIGALAAVSAILMLGYGRLPAINRRLALGLAAGAVIAVFGLLSVWNSYVVQNVVFHADESTVLEDPNELRLRFWRESLQNIADEPLGYGPGTAGLASIRNQEQGTILNENYYLQIAHEVGVIGLVLFLSIIAVVAVRLYGLSGDRALALGLLASFAGLAVTNFLVHAWSNEAVAYTWWGLAGLAIYRR